MQVMVYMAMLQAIYFIATAVALSVLIPTQKQVTHYFNQLGKHIMLNSLLYTHSYECFMHHDVEWLYMSIL